MSTPLKLFDFSLGVERLLRDTDILIIGSDFQSGGNIYINSDNITDDLESSFLLFSRGNLSPHARIEWSCLDDRFKINFPVEINSALYFSGSSSINTLSSLTISSSPLNLNSLASLNLKDSNLSSYIPLSESGVSNLIGFTAVSIVGSLNELMDDKAEISDITFETLDLAGDVGTGSTQLARGDHVHSYFSPQVTTYFYVDSNRTDSYTENGKIETPYKDLQDAIDNAGDGYTLLLSPGIYSGVIVPNDRSISLKGLGQGRGNSVVVEYLELENSLLERYFLAVDIRFFKVSAPVSPVVYLGHNWRAHFERCEIMNQGVGDSINSQNLSSIFSGGIIQGTITDNASDYTVFDDDLHIIRNSGVNKIYLVNSAASTYFRGVTLGLQIQKSVGYLYLSVSVIENGGVDLPLLVNNGGQSVLNDLIVDEVTQTAIFSGSGIFWACDGAGSVIYVGTHSILDGTEPYRHIENSLMTNGGIVTNLPYPLKASDSTNDSSFVFGDTVSDALTNLLLKVTYHTVTATDESNGYCIITPAANGPSGVKNNIEVSVINGSQFYRGHSYTATNSDDNSKIAIIWKTSGFSHPEFSVFIHPAVGLVGYLEEGDIISIQYQ